MRVIDIHLRPGREAENACWIGGTDRFKEREEERKNGRNREKEGEERSGEVEGGGEIRVRLI